MRTSASIEDQHDYYSCFRRFNEGINLKPLMNAELPLDFVIYFQRAD
jgi:hypothetical protein